MNLEDLRDRDQALTVPCPQPPHGCGVEAGQPCIRLIDGHPLANLPAHVHRLHAAGVVHAPLDSRELHRAD